MEQSTSYQPDNLEAEIAQFWKTLPPKKVAATATPYTIILPPPNVTGSLHMGHAFQDTLMDILIRFHRMQGDAVFWQVGTDHAGIATQMVVERQLEQKGITRQSLGREAFVEKVWEWKQESGDSILSQMQRLGLSAAWDHSCFTLDEPRSQAVTECFLRLYEDGLIYRGQKLVNWDPTLQTALSDLEVISEETKGSLWHIRYPLEDGSGHIVVATTRPETLLGDVAVAVHPEDPRYESLIGKKLRVPLCDRLIPVIADDTVLADFGTGAVKITPAHDFNDFEMGQRHELPSINIFTPTAHLNDNTPEAYRGLERFAARKKIVADLESLGLMEKIIPHTIMLPRGDRTNAVLEPYMTAQWFVRAKPLAEKALEVARNGELNFVPSHWSKTYFNWLENIQDWCISRQLWWGHQIPAWYDSEGKFYVGRDEASVRKAHNLTGPLTQEQDVLDTWFSSALWPLSPFGWPEDTQSLKDHYPSAVLVTGFDIIFFWVARMVMMGMYFKKQSPFKTVYVHGLIQDSQGQKMSKSKGNVIDPIDLIDGISLEALLEKRTASLMQPKMKEKILADTKQTFPEGIAKYGTDTTRFAFALLATQARHLRFEMSRLESCRNFMNKLWNATRFVMPYIKDVQRLAPDMNTATPFEGWIATELSTLSSNLKNWLAEYRFDLAGEALYRFFWENYCDWYIEVTKTQLQDESLSAEQKNRLASTLGWALEQFLTLAHPFMPFITEYLWQQLPGNAGKALMHQDYPKLALHHEAACQSVAWFQEGVCAVRAITTQHQLGRVEAVWFDATHSEDKVRLEQFKPLMSRLAKIQEIHLGPYTEKNVLKGVFGQVQIFIPQSLEAMKAEAQRLQREQGKLQIELDKVQQKLNNPAYVEKAPAAVVEKERAREKELMFALTQIQTALNEKQSVH